MNNKFLKFFLSFLLLGLPVFLLLAVPTTRAVDVEEWACDDLGAPWNRDYSSWRSLGEFSWTNFKELSPGFTCVKDSEISDNTLYTYINNSKSEEPILDCEKKTLGAYRENSCPKNSRCVRLADCASSLIGGVCFADGKSGPKQADINCQTGTAMWKGEEWQVLRFRCPKHNKTTCWAKVSKPPEEKIPPITPGLEETPRDPKKTPNISVGDCCRQIVPPLDDPYNNDYTLNDVVQTAVNVYECILCIVGALILMALVAGAIILMISGGNDKRVAMGKQIITGAVIGGVIVFFSFLIVNFVVKAVGARFIDEGKVQVNPQGYLPSSDSSAKTS